MCHVFVRVPSDGALKQDHTNSDPISNQIVSILEQNNKAPFQIFDDGVLMTVNHQEQRTVLYLLPKQQHHVYQGFVKDCSVLTLDTPSQLLCLSSAGKLFVVEFKNVGDRGSRIVQVFKGGSVHGYHVNHNTKQIVVLSSVFLKKSQMVHILDFSLNILHSYSLQQQGLQCLLLDSGVCVILTSSGSCMLLKQDLQKTIGDGYSKMCMQHTNNRFMLVDSTGMVSWCTHKGRIQKTPVHMTHLPEWIQPIKSGFYCAFCPVDDAVVHIELIIDISRHDVHCRGRPGSIQPQTLCHISRNQSALSFHRNDAICIYERRETVLLSLYRIDSDGFERYINLLVEDKLFDTALKLVHRRKATDPSIDRLESRLLYQLAYCQVYEDKDYENGLLNLSTCCRNDTIRLLNFFDFLLPSSLRDEHYSAAPRLSEEESRYLSSCVLPYLWSHRSRIVAENASDNNLLMLLDTAIFQCLVHSPDSGALFQFLQRRDVKVDYKSSRILLQQQGRYFELLELYKSQGHHSTAMDLLYKLSTAADTLVPAPVGASSELEGRPGAWAAVKYLSTIADPEPSLVKFHCRWIISLDPEAAVDMFVHLYPSISASLSASILSQDNTVDSYLYATRYLEEIYDSLSPGDREVLGSLYLKIMASSNLSSDSKGDVLNKLRQLLQDNDSFDISKMLSILPARKQSSSEMLEARVLLLEKQKMYEGFFFFTPMQEYLKTRYHMDFLQG